MTLKKILLTAVAVGAVAAASSAGAVTLTANLGNGSALSNGNTPVVGTFNGTGTPYKLAKELNYTTGISAGAGAFDTFVTFNNALTAGTYTLTITYAGATITTPPAASATAAANTASVGFVNSTTASTPSLTLTSSTATSATYTLQISGADTVSELYFAPALNVTGNLAVTVGIINSVTSGQADPGANATLVTTTNSALTFASTPVNETIAAGAVGGILDGISGASLGSVTATFSGAKKDFAGTSVSASDVASITDTVTGDVSTLNVSVTGAATITGTKSGTTSTAAVVSPAVGADLTPTFALVLPAGSTKTLSPSTYSDVMAVTYKAGTFSGSDTSASLNIGSLNLTAGAVTQVVPWVSSATLVASTGNTTIIRLSNTSNVNAGPVYAQLLDSTKAGTATNATALLGTLGAASNTGAGEFVITSTTLQNAFGDFGRGDFRILVPGPGATITGGSTTCTSPNVLGGISGTSVTPTVNNTTCTTVSVPVGAIIMKRVLAGVNGGLTEVLNLGDAASPTISPVLQAVGNPPS